MGGPYDRYYLGTSSDCWILMGDSSTAGFFLGLFDLPFSFLLDTAFLPLDFTMTLLDDSGKTKEKGQDTGVE